MTLTSLPCSALIAASLVVALPAAAAAAPRPPVPSLVSRDAVPWDLVFEAGNRRCRLFLRVDPRGDGYAIGVPSACTLAFPALAAVTNWSPGPHEQVLFRGDKGATVLDFAPDGTAALSATTAKGEVYSLTPIVPAVQDDIRAAGAAPAPGSSEAGLPAPPVAPGDGVLVDRAPGTGAGARPGSVAAAPMLPPATLAEVAGNYAVFRQNRDTGCMVTLEPGTARGEARARLAPACRDQGIVIFDPSSWRLVRNQLVLSAKRGHTTELARSDEKTWSNAPAHGAALVLKRL